MKFTDFLEKVRGQKAPLPDRFGEWLGYEIAAFDQEGMTVETTLTVRKDQLSPSGAIHGGVISAFLDFTCGAAVFIAIEPTHLCSTVDLGVKYFRPLREGDRVVAEARVIHRGRSLCSSVACLYMEDDRSKRLAMATGTFNIYPIKALR